MASTIANAFLGPGNLGVDSILFVGSPKRDVPPMPIFLQSKLRHDVETVTFKDILAQAELDLSAHRGVTVVRPTLRELIILLNPSLSPPCLQTPYGKYLQV